MKDIIFVEGDIIIESGSHIAKELVAFAGENWRRISEKIINEDYFVPEQDITSYKVYCASGDIIVFEGQLSALNHPSGIGQLFHAEIKNLQNLRIQEIDESLKKVLNRQIYIGVVGCMELFLADFLHSMVLGLRKYFDRYYQNCSDHFKSQPGKVQDRISEKILNRTLFHRIDDIKAIYKNVLDVDFPPVENLKELIVTRHNLVHRVGYPDIRSEYKEVETKTIDDLITEIETLVSHIIKSLEAEIKSWIPEV